MWIGPAVDRFQGASRSEATYRAVRDMIARGVLRPGSPFSRRALSKQLGFGLLPITEAMKRLEYDGLLESKPRAGTRVRIPTLQDVRDLCVVREALETQSARLFAVEAAGPQKAEAIKIAGELDRLISDRESPLGDFLAMHVLFHRRVAQSAGCQMLLAAVERTSILQQTWLSAAELDLRWMMVPDHLELARILGRGDPEESGRAMRAHVRHRVGELMHYLEKFLEEGATSRTPMKRSDGSL